MIFFTVLNSYGYEVGETVMSLTNSSLIKGTIVEILPDNKRVEIKVFPHRRTRIVSIESLRAYTPVKSYTYKPVFLHGTKITYKIGDTVIFCLLDRSIKVKVKDITKEGMVQLQDLNTDQVIYSGDYFPVEEYFTPYNIENHLTAEHLENKFVDYFYNNFAKIKAFAFGSKFCTYSLLYLFSSATAVVFVKPLWILAGPASVVALFTCFVNREDAQIILGHSEQNKSIDNKLFHLLKNEIGYNNAIYIMRLKANGVEDEKIFEEIKYFVQNKVEIS